MKIENIEEGIEVLKNAFPCSNQIKDHLLKDNAIYFTWRAGRYRLDCHYCRVDEVCIVDKLDGSILVGTDICIVMTELIKRQLTTPPIA